MSRREDPPLRGAIQDSTSVKTGHGWKQDQAAYQEGVSKLSDLQKPAKEKIRRRGFRDTHCLTPRQTQITELLLDGYRYAEIANKLFMSVNTVRYHA